MKNTNSEKSGMAKREKIPADQAADGEKRALLKWAPPLVMAVVLPRHAQATHVDPACTSSLVAVAPVPSKCAGPANALVGQAIITITSDSDPIEILSITHNAPATDTITPPTLPAMATNSSSTGVDIGWQGPGSDAITCLPLSTITLTITYNCGEHTAEVTAEVNVTEVLAAAIP